MERKKFKRIVCVIVFLMVFQAVCAPAFATTSTKTNGYYTYTSTEKDWFRTDQATIIGYSGSEASLKIPDHFQRGIWILGKFFGDWDDVVEIGNEVFANNNSIVTVTIPEGVTKIGDGAFRNCSNLKSVIIPETVETIGVEAFKGCTSLESIYIPITVKTLGHSSFEGCVNLKKADIRGYSLTAVEDHMFDGCTNLQSIQLPRYIKSIGIMAFHRCEKLEVVDMTRTKVTTIGMSAFLGCNALTAVYLPLTLADIKTQAFLGCNQLTNAEFVGPAPEMGDMVFSNAAPGFSVYYLAGRTSFVTEERPNKWVISAAQVYPAKAKPSIQGVTLDEFVYKTSELGNVCMISKYNGPGGDIVIPTRLKGKQVVGIWSKAFFDNDALTSVKVPVTIKSIGEHAFEGCDNLTRVELENGVSKIRASAFKHCGKLESVSIPKSVTGIEYAAFAYCTNLKYAYFEGDAPTLDQYVFYRTSADFMVYHNPQTTRFTEPVWEPFAEDRYLCVASDYTFTEKNGQLTVTGYCGADTDLVLPETIAGKPVVAVGRSAFFDNDTITSVKMPSSLQTVDERAFENCDNLSHVELNEGVSLLASSAFKYCRRLQSIFIPSSVRTMGYAVFAYCFDLDYAYFDGNRPSMSQYAFLGHPSGFRVYYNPWKTGYTQPTWVSFSGDEYESVASNCTFTMANGEVTLTGYLGRGGDVVLPETILGFPVTVVGQSAFFDNDAITSVKMPSSLRTVDERAFEGCDNLRSVELNDGVSMLASSAFKWCTSLESISIPASVRNIGYATFAYCSALKYAYFDGNAPTMSQYGFYRTSDNFKVYYNPVATGFAEPTWTAFSGDKYRSVASNCTYRIIGSDVTITGYLGRGSEVALPETIEGYPVKTVGRSAFFGNDTITSVTMPSGLRTVDERAFEGCDNLRRVELNDGVSMLASSAFKWCIGLESVRIPSSVRNFGYATFAYCSSLKAAYFDGNAPIMSQYGFYQTPTDFVVYYSSVHSGFTSPTWKAFRGDIYNSVAIDNNDLSGLTLSAGVLSPVFDAGTQIYAATVGSDVESITVTASLAESEAKLTVNGQPVENGMPSQEIALNLETANVISIVVTAKDGTDKTYTVTVTRGAPVVVPGNNADLSGLTLSAGVLSPVFDAGTQTYAATVGSDVESMTVTASLAEPEAKLTVNGQPVENGMPSQTIALNEGIANEISLVVTAADGTEKIYTVTVTRGAPIVVPGNNADLSGLTLSAGVLAPVFDAGTQTYAATVGSDVESITVTASIAESEAKLTVNGQPVENGMPSQEIALNLETANVISIVVTAKDGTDKIYTVTVTRGAPIVVPGSNADLSSLVLSTGVLGPDFEAGVLRYSATVENEEASISLTCELADSMASRTVQANDVLVAGAGESIPAIPLNIGVNCIEILVAAEDGTEKTYTVIVTREAPMVVPSGNANLSGLSLRTGALIPAFDTDIQTYDASVEYAVESITVTGILTDSKGSLMINGLPVENNAASEEMALVVGINRIEILVTAEDGTVKTYVVNITREGRRSGRMKPLISERTFGGRTLASFDDHHFGLINQVRESGAKDYKAPIRSQADEVFLRIPYGDLMEKISANACDLVVSYKGTEIRIPLTVFEGDWMENLPCESDAMFEIHMTSEQTGVHVCSIDFLVVEQVDAITKLVHRVRVQ